jgi:hypothetical protein
MSERSETSFQLIRVAGGTWNQSCSEVPSLLAQAGVPEAVWQQTFDEASQRNESVIPHVEKTRAAKRQLGPLLFVAWVAMLSFFISLSATEQSHGPWPLVCSVGVFFLCLLLIWCLSGPLYESQSHALAWVYCVREQLETYRPYGIQVQMLVVPNGGLGTLLIGCLQFNCITSTTPSLAQDLHILDSWILRLTWCWEHFVPIKEKAKQLRGHVPTIV